MSKTELAAVLMPLWAGSALLTRVSPVRRDFVGVIFFNSSFSSTSAGAAGRAALLGPSL